MTVSRRVSEDDDMNDTTPQETGPGGEPLYEWIDVREIMWERQQTTDTA